MSGTLYIVGTPIGNLNDLSPRAVQTMNSVDFIAAEDTRVSLKLLNHFGVRKPLVSYFEHNKRTRGAEIVERLLKGESCALITDAGMPVLSDPGEDIVALCAENGIEVSVVPGPCAAISALALSGLPSGRFCFEGFLSVNKKSRREHLAAIRDEPRTLVFYEAPHKLKKTLADLYEVFGERRVAVARELTKLHEEVIRTTLSGAISLYEEKEPKGEFVLVIEGKRQAAGETGGADALSAACELVKRFKEEGMSHSEAVKLAAEEADVSRSELYRHTL